MISTLVMEYNILIPVEKPLDAATSNKTSSDISVLQGSRG